MSTNPVRRCARDWYSYLHRFHAAAKLRGSRFSATPRSDQTPDLPYVRQAKMSRQEPRNVFYFHRTTKGTGQEQRTRIHGVLMVVPTRILLLLNPLVIGWIAAAAAQDKPAAITADADANADQLSLDLEQSDIRI
jgi:hypothetical protein